MSAARASFELFELPPMQGKPNRKSPQRLAPKKFSESGVKEVQHLEQWICACPLILGEELKVVTNQFAGFKNSDDRLDILALDREGRLVVIEIKRGKSDRFQDLQALQYAASASTFTADDLVKVHAAYLWRAEKREVTEQESRQALQSFIKDDLDKMDDDRETRIILTAPGFHDKVVATVLWLRQQHGLKISCIQLVPYQVDKKLLLGSSILVPLP